MVTDAASAYVLKVIFYTGKYTYHADPADEALKKTVKVVKELCLPYKGSHRCIYVDRFYTSIELLKELDKLDLYVTGTCMKNRLPKEVVIDKKSAFYGLKVGNKGKKRSRPNFLPLSLQKISRSL